MREIPLFALLGLSGAAGAILRHAVSSWLNPVTSIVPCGTLMVNVVGCLLLGGLACAAGIESANVSHQWRLVMGTGFLGALTTFSTFGVETFERIERGAIGYALINIALNVIVGLLAVWLGHLLAAWWWNLSTT